MPSRRPGDDPPLVALLVAARKRAPILVTVDGLKDRTGRLRAKIYPATTGDLLADDKVLVAREA